MSDLGEKRGSADWYMRLRTNRSSLEDTREAVLVLYCRETDGWPEAARPGYKPLGKVACPICRRLLPLNSRDGRVCKRCLDRLRQRADRQLPLLTK